MDDEDDVPYCCIFPRCRLCQFSLVVGDSVVASIPDGRQSHFTFESVLFREDPILRIKFHTCNGVHCQIGDFRAPLFHTRCFDFKLLPISPSFLAATDYNFQPSSREEQRRFGRTCRLLEPKLRDALPVTLPPEVLSMIARFLVYECAVVTAQEQILEHGSTESLVDLSDNVYAQYHMVDGVRYVKSLRNSKSETDVEEKLLFNAQKMGSSTVSKIVIAEDHLGIRLVKFAPSCIVLTELAHLSGVWWRDVSRPCGIAKISVRTDGLKLRDVVDAVETGSSGCDTVRWMAPEHPTRVIDLTTLRYPHRYPTTLRMCYFDCNALDTTGYSVATNGVNIATIHAHGRDDDLHFYKVIDSSSYKWIHMPVDRGEYLTEICRQAGFRHGKIPTPRLMFITNQARSTLFGCHTPTTGTIQLERMHTPPQTKSRIYFNAWDSVPENEVRYLAFQGTEVPTVRNYPESLLPTLPGPYTTSNEPWFFSTCNIRGVTEITLCKDTSLGHKPIIGMLLRYADDHRACVGQFRFDMTLETIRVEQGMALYFGSRRTTKLYLYVAEVTVCPPFDPELAWINVPWERNLEWWLSSRHSIVRFR